MQFILVSYMLPLYHEKCLPQIKSNLDTGIVKSIIYISWFLSVYLFIYLGFYVAFNTVQVISRRVVGRAEETSTYSSLGFCTVNCRPTASNYQLSHLRPCWESNPASEVGGESVTTLPPGPLFSLSV